MTKFKIKKYKNLYVENLFLTVDNLFEFLF